MNRIIIIGLLVWAGWTGLSSYIWVCKYKNLCGNCKGCSADANLNAGKPNFGEFDNFDDLYGSLGIGNLKIKDGDRLAMIFDGNFVTDKNLDTLKYPSSAMKSFASLKDLLNQYAGNKELTIYANYDPDKESPEKGNQRVAFLKGLFNKFGVSTDGIKFVNQAKKGMFDLSEKNVPCLDFRLNNIENLAKEEYKEKEPSNAELIAMFTSQPILFEYSNEVFIEDLNSFFDNLASFLKKSNKKIKLVGHTDNVSSSTLNQTLGLKRAKKVKNELTKRGVSSNKIAVQSRGERSPAFSNKTEEGRQKNRRVQLIF